MKRPRVHFEKGPIGWLQRYALLSYDHPFLLFLALLIAIIFIAVLGVAFGFELSESGHEWEIKTNKHVKEYAAIEEALDDLSEESVQSSYSIVSDSLEIFVTYQVKVGDRTMFTAENLESQRQVENDIMSLEFGKLCLRNYDVGPNDPILCDRPLSLLGYFFEYSPDPPQFTDTWLNGTAERTIREGLKRINEDPFRASFFLDENFASTNKTEYTRSRFQLGLPIDYSKFKKAQERIANGERLEDLPMYNNSKTDEEDQVNEVYDEFLKDLEQRLFDLLGMEKPSPLTTEYNDFGELDNLEVLFLNSVWQDKEFERVVLTDFMWGAFSVISVWIYMLIHLGSVFLSVVGILEIFLSFPVALFFYRLVFQIKFFSEVNLLVVFILLGIGADDIFVFTDAYKQSANVPGVDPSLQGRLMYTCARASKAVFVTSFTTMAAFFATAVTPLMPMQAFGIFAALCIVFLFLINIMMMPPALVLYAGYTPYISKWLCPCCLPSHRPEWVNKFCPCCTCCHVEIDETFFMPIAEASETQETRGSKPPPPENVAPAEIEMTTEGAQQPQPKGNEETDQRGPGPSEAPYGQGEHPIVLNRVASLAEAKLDDLRFIEKFFYGPFFIFVNRFKWPIVILAIALFGIGIGYTTTFKTPDETEKWFPSDHVFNRLQELFDPNTTPFVTSSEDSVSEVRLVWGLSGMNPNNRDIWVHDDYGDLVYDDKFDPTPEENQVFLLNVCPLVRETPCNADACNPKWLIQINQNNDNPLQQKCWIEDFNQWLQRRQNMTIPVPRKEFIPLLAEYLEVEAHQVTYGEQIGYSRESKELKFFFFEFDSTFRPPASDSKTEDVIDEWEDFIDRLNQDAIDQGLDGVSRAYETGGEAWIWPSTSKALIQGAVSGLILVFVLAFVVLNFVTGNLIISIIAVLTVAGIVATVMGIGIRAIMDWDLGTAETITVVILIGFSMDYTLHLSDAYMESPHTNRADRMRDALTHLGISVTAGAATTLISSLFLWATILIFFQKFAFNVTATVFVSYIFSIFVFPAMCLIFGPEGDRGNWSSMLSCCKKSKSHH